MSGGSGGGGNGGRTGGGSYGAHVEHSGTINNMKQISSGKITKDAALSDLGSQKAEVTKRIYEIKAGTRKESTFTNVKDLKADLKEINYAIKQISLM